jgi:hypothetical protein
VHGWGSCTGPVIGLLFILCFKKQLSWQESALGTMRQQRRKKTKTKNQKKTTKKTSPVAQACGCAPIFSAQK